MSINNGKIIAPVGMASIIGDIQQVIGETSGDLGTLCKSDKVNMWAKYKPVRYDEKNTKDQLTNNVWKADSQFNGIENNPAWWWGDYDFGIDVTNAKVTVSTAAQGEYSMVWGLEQLAAKIDGHGNGWARRKPRGSSGYAPIVDTQQDSSTRRNEWYREIDFHLYNHTVAAPIMGATIGDGVVAASVDGLWHIDMGMRTATDNGIDNRDFIFPWDVLTLLNNKKIGGQTVTYPMYVGMAIYKVENGSYAARGWVTGSSNSTGSEFKGAGILNSDAQSSAEISFGDTSVEMKLKNNCNYVVLPFFCSKELPQPPHIQTGEPMVNYSTQPAGCTIWTCPYVDFLPFTAVQASSTQRIGLPALSNKTISISGNYTTTVYLDATDPYYIGGTATVQVMIVNSKYNYGDTPSATNSAYSSNVADYTVTAGTKTTILTTPSRTLSSSEHWKVIVWVNGQYLGGVFSLIQPDDRFIPESQT